MTSIPPISTTRVTDAMTRGRLTAQIQSDQRALERLQNQLSTGYRIFLPSDDAASAQRAMTLQRTIERKEQSATNVQGSIAALANTEATLAELSTTLNALKSQSLAVIGSPASEQQRQGVVSEINALLDTIVQVGNREFTGSYLLGGAERASAPYAASQGPYYEYLGDESSPQTYADIGYLFDVGTPGDDVLGGLSESVRGGVDLNPQLTSDTRLAQLNGGLGVSPNGSIEIVYDPASPSEPAETALIDLSGAETVEDVARLIESNAPAGSGVTVEAVGGSLRLASTGGAIAIREVGEGNTALELGIRTGETPLPAIIGADLNPTVRLNGRLDDLGGVKATGRIELTGDNNDLVLRANANGAAYNGVEVQIVDGASVGAETAVYDAGSNRLTVTIADGESSAADIAAAINAQAPEFTAEVDYRDQSAIAARGTGSVSATTIAAATSGGVNGGIDVASGLRITNGPEEYVIDTSAAETVEDLLNLLNNSDYGLSAGLTQDGTGIDVRSRRSGADFTIGEDGGTTAADLGIRTTVASTRLEDFNRGVGVFEPGVNATDDLIQNEFRITVVQDGVTGEYTIDPRELTTVQDLFNQIATDTGGAVSGSLASTGSGLTLASPNASAAGDFPLNGDTLTITANSAGASGNEAGFNLTIVDSGSGAGSGLQTTVDPDGVSITVDLRGADSDTAAIAASISAALPGYGVVAGAADGSIAVSQSDAGGPPIAFSATGGRFTNSITVSGDYAERLGFVPAGQESVTVNADGLTSTDRNPHEVDSVFTTLIRMRDALGADDIEAFEREVNRLDDDLDRVTFGRAEVGVRLRTLETVEQRLADEEVQLRAALSNEIDADLVEVISEYNAQQASLEASLRASATLVNLSILDFI